MEDDLKIDNIQRQQSDAKVEDESGMDVLPEESQRQDREQDQQRQRQRSQKRQKCLKVLVLVVLLVLLVWLVLANLSTWMLSLKTTLRVHTAPEAVELSGLQQDGYISYYYFMRMQERAKEIGQGIEQQDIKKDEEFSGITFDQLYGVFKVLKAVQHAKNYSTVAQEDQNNTESYYSAQTQVLEASYNYTNYMGPAADQYRCGSCYSFPITATIEFLYQYHLNISVKLSEQQLIDCSMEDDTIDGCKAGNMTKGFEYAVKYGLMSEEDYPYRSKDGNSFPCNKKIVDDPSIKKYKIGGFRSIPHGNCEAIQYELSRNRTVASMINHGELNSYTSRTTHAFRSCQKSPFDHAIAIVGQTDAGSWIVRNSWGVSWGKEGYFVMKGGDTCGVCSYAIVPHLEGQEK